ncbi:hypothetical protein, partial [Cyanobium gracile]
LSTGRLHTWSVDSQWKYISSGAIVSPTSTAGQLLQQQFMVDATGTPLASEPPTTSPPPPISSSLQVLDPNGVVQLLRDSSSDLVTVQINGVASPLLFKGAQVKASQFKGWQILAAETVGSNQNQILWKELSTGRLHTWSVDSQWKYISSGAIVSPTSTAGQLLQQQFMVDASGTPLTSQPPPPPVPTGIKIIDQAYLTIRSAIGAAVTNSVIELGVGTFNITKSDADPSDPAAQGTSPPTLTRTSLSGISLKGTGSQSTTIIGNPRIYTRQSDGTPPTAFTLDGLTLRYEVGAQGYILAPSRGSLPYDPIRPTMDGLSIIDVTFVGQHKGGFSGTYMDISGARDILFDGISVDLDGQSGYVSSTGEGGGFFLFMEGGRNLQVRNSVFLEDGYSSSLIALFMSDVIVDSNQFIGAGLAKREDVGGSGSSPRGERFYNAGGEFTNNQLSAGAFLDYLYIVSDQGTVWRDYLAKEGPVPELTTRVAGNTFDILDGGYGILIRSDLPRESLQGFLDVQGNVFNDGIAIRSELQASGALVFGANVVNGEAFDGLYIGGLLDDEINASGDIDSRSWISGDLGNDTLTGGAMADAFVFATAPNSSSNVDTISNFSVVDGDKIWIDNSIFTSGFEGITQVDNDSNLELHFSGTLFAILSGLGSNPLTASDFVVF